MIQVQSNRASALFQQAAQRLNQSIPTADYPVFSYWCRFYGENLNEQEISIKLVEPGDYNPLESKLRVSELLREHNIKDVFPPTFSRVDDAIAHSPQPTLWFIKPSHLSGGRGIQVVAQSDLPSSTIPRHSIIQAGVENIELFEGRKYTARIYVLLWNQEAYLFDDGFVVIHAPQYQKGSTEYSVQVDHRGYQADDSGVEMRIHSDLDSFVKTTTQAREALRRILPILQPTLRATSKQRYLILGIDLLPLADGRVRFIEINAMPNFVHSRAINQGLNVFFFEHVMRIVYGFGSTRFTKISEAAASRVFIMKRSR